VWFFASSKSYIINYNVHTYILKMNTNFYGIVGCYNTNDVFSTPIGIIKRLNSNFKNHGKYHNIDIVCLARDWFYYLEKVVPSARKI
jgi:hypothetical protein